MKKNMLLAIQIKALSLWKRTKSAVMNRHGEGFVDTAVKVLMAVVIGALVLAGLYLLFNEIILPELTERIQEMFNYQG